VKMSVHESCAACADVNTADERSYTCEVDVQLYEDPMACDRAERSVEQPRGGRREVNHSVLSLQSLNTTYPNETVRARAATRADTRQSKTLAS
jgi:hypothetical protein